MVAVNIVITVCTGAEKVCKIPSSPTHTHRHFSHWEEPKEVILGYVVVENPGRSLQW